MSAPFGWNSGRQLDTVAYLHTRHFRASIGPSCNAFERNKIAVGGAGAEHPNQDVVDNC